jgi:hypothetical protein
MTRMQTLAHYQDYEIVIGVNGCVYLVDPDGWRVADSPYSALLMSPAGVRTELAKQLNGGK